MATINWRTNVQWRKLIADCETSGLTQEQWCAEHNINLYTLRDRATRLIRLDEQAQQQITESQGFVEVTSVTEEPSVALGKLVIEAAGCRLTANADYPVNALVALLRSWQIMLTFAGKRIYLACGATDGRKQINGLSVIVEASFKLDPFDAAILVFCNRARDRLKILEFDGDGFWLYLKRLESGRFKWPDDAGGKTMDLSEEDLRHLLGSPGLEQRLRRKKPSRALL